MKKMSKQEYKGLISFLQSCIVPVSMPVPLSSLIVMGLKDALTVAPRFGVDCCVRSDIHEAAGPAFNALESIDRLVQCTLAALDGRVIDDMDLCIELIVAELYGAENIPLMDYRVTVSNRSQNGVDGGYWQMFNVVAQAMQQACDMAVEAASASEPGCTPYNATSDDCYVLAPSEASEAGVTFVDAGSNG